MTIALNTENRDYITWQYQDLNFGLLGGLKIEGLERMRVTLKVEYKELQYGITLTCTTMKALIN
ncbi:hypothetical protein [Longitalea luteola]|uniref:hypothetical protein n=1 Tax=Longitalea luteola TaxID=2812563 RepID=UPI001A966A14|nr:hypothetical protein [Longitalea luteola]